MIEKFNELDTSSMFDDKNNKSENNLSLDFENIFLSKEEQRLKEIRSRLVASGVLKEHTIKKKNKRKKR